MTEFHSKDRFDEVKENLKIRVNETHPLDLFLGKSEDGYPYLEFEGYFKNKKVLGTSTIAVRQYASDNGKKSIFFLLTDLQLINNFCAFVDDMVISSDEIDNPDTGYTFLTDRFQTWKRTFGSHPKLSTSEVQGLIGELLFLKDTCIPKYGESTAVAGWSGSEKTSKDFSFEDFWYEIKTTSNSKRSITITSLGQLESTQPGYLVTYILDKRSEIGSGIELNSLVHEIDNSFKNVESKIIFRQKLFDAGYILGQPDTDNYSSQIYELIACKMFKVDDKFPIIRRKDIDQRISSVSYGISLNDIEELKCAEEQK